MQSIITFSVTLLTLALAAPAVAEEPGETDVQSHAELLERLDRYHDELSERLQQQIEARMTTQVDAELSKAFEQPVRSRHAGGTTDASIARSE